MNSTQDDLVGETVIFSRFGREFVVDVLSAYYDGDYVEYVVRDACGYEMQVTPEFLHTIN